MVNISFHKFLLFRKFLPVFLIPAAIFLTLMLQLPPAGAGMPAPLSPRSAAAAAANGDPFAGAEILRVDAQSIDLTPDGSSWAAAFPNLQDALAAARLLTATTPVEIWVAQGVYYPDEGAGQIGDSPTSTFRLEGRIALFGGFAATETVRSERSVQQNLTVLSGDLEQNDPDLNPAGFVVDPNTIIGPNAYHVVTAENITQTALLDGFIISAGLSEDLASCPNGCGAGLFARSSSLEVNSVTFFGSKATYGGGVYIESGAVSLTYVTLRRNLASLAGGGIYITASSPILNQPILVENQALGTAQEKGLGGGIFSADSPAPRLINGLMAANTARDGGGGIYLLNSDLILTNSTLSSNQTITGSGGLELSGSSPLIQNGIFWQNTNQQGSSQSAQIGIHEPISPTSMPVVSHSLVEGGIYTGTGNLSAHPLFVQPPDAGDGDWSTWGDNLLGDLRLLAGSPAIDQGDNLADLDGGGAGSAVIADVAADLDGKTRLINGVVDLGAFERAPLDLVAARLTSSTAELSWIATEHQRFELRRSSDPFSGYVVYQSLTGSPYVASILPAQNDYFEVQGVWDNLPLELSGRVGIFTFPISPGN